MHPTCAAIRLGKLFATEANHLAAGRNKAVTRQVAAEGRERSLSDTIYRAVINVSGQGTRGIALHGADAVLGVYRYWFTPSFITFPAAS